MKTSYRSWMKKFNEAKNDLNKAQKAYEPMQEVHALVKDARIDLAEEIHSDLYRIYEDYLDKSSREGENGRRYNGVLKGISECLRSVEDILKGLK